MIRYLQKQEGGVRGVLKVFLVEDEAIIREGFRDIIPWQQYGYVFAGEAADGEQALPLIRSTKPDVLITDIRMPFMDGLVLSRLVSRELPDTKIIIISGYDDFEYARQALRIGVEQYLLKPVTKAMLIRTLVEVKEKIQSEREKKELSGGLSKGLRPEEREPSLRPPGQARQEEQLCEADQDDGQSRRISEETQDEEVSLRNLNMARIDSGSLREFLQNGLLQDIRKFAKDYVESLKDAADSRLFCQYIMLNVRFLTLAYVEELGCAQADLLDGMEVMEMTGRAVSRDELEEYIAKVLERAIELREKETKGRHRNIVSEALAFIGEHYAEESLSLKDVASFTKVSASYFSAVFSQEMGQTFVEYLTQKRMERAKELLRRTDKRTAEIANETGYRDPHYFSFVFRKTQGCTPRDYRMGGKQE